MIPSERMSVGASARGQLARLWRCAEIVGNPTPRQPDKAEDDDPDGQGDSRPKTEATNPRGRPQAGH